MGSRIEVADADAQALVIDSLERCAERSGDIVPAVMARFFEADPAARQLMEHTDQPMQGRMLEAALDLLMSDDLLEAGGYLEWEVNNHVAAYAVEAPMYDSFFASLCAVVRESLAEEWNEHLDAAWRQRVGLITARVAAHGA